MKKKQTVGQQTIYPSVFLSFCLSVYLGCGSIGDGGGAVLTLASMVSVVAVAVAGVVCSTKVSQVYIPRALQVTDGCCSDFV